MTLADDDKNGLSAELAASGQNLQSVFLVHHVHVLDEEYDEEDVKIIGCYSSSAFAQAAIERVRVAAGFRDDPDGFSISEYALNQDNWVEGYIAYQPEDSE